MAAANGENYAMSNLGYQYADSTSTLYNPQDAYMWMVLAVANADSDRMEELTTARDEYRLKLSPRQIDQAQREALGLQEKINAARQKQ